MWDGRGGVRWNFGGRGHKAHPKMESHESFVGGSDVYLHVVNLGAKLDG